MKRKLKVISSDKKDELSSYEKREIFNLYNKNFLKSQWSWKKFKSYFLGFKDHLMVVSVKNDYLVGFVAGKKYKKSFFLEILLIEKSFRGGRFAGFLLEIFLKEVKASFSKIIFLHFRESNDLTEFYKKFGFSNKKRAGFYKNGEEKYQLRKDL